MNRTNSLIEFDHVACSYGGPAVIDHVSFALQPGEFLGIVGPSGSGKTTVLRTMLGAVRPVRGEIRRSSPDLPMAYVPQVETVDWNFPVTVTEVVTMSRGTRPWRAAARSRERAEVAELLERLGIGDLGDRQIRQLSGGQQQRVFLARALAQRPQLVVLDEPTSGVDVRTRHEVLHVLADLNAEGIAIVLTTHDLNGLAAHLPRILCFNHTVIADGPPAEVLTPAVLEATYGAPMDVLIHGGMPVVLESVPQLRAVAGDPSLDPEPPSLRRQARG
jgi:ABC-type Mn2+/Zn2+ transport system ATPase subunit